MRQLIPLLFATAAFAAEGLPLAEVSVPDGARLRRHLDASIYGQLWADPACAPLRARVLAQLDQMNTEQQIDLAGWYAAFRSGGATVEAPSDGGSEPRAFLVADFGDLAPTVFARWRSAGGTDELVPGVDAAFRDASANKSLITRMGGIIASTSDGSRIPPWRPTPGPADLSIRLDGPAIGILLAKNVPAQGPLLANMMAGPGMAAAYGHLNYDLTLVPEGVLERLVSDAPAPWWAAVDRAVLDRLPTNALAALAIGVDGKQLWTTIREPVLQLAATSQGLSLDDAEDTLSASLAEFGVDTGLSGLIGGITGTFTLAVTPAAPFPAVTLAVPRSPGIDQLIAALTARLGGEVPLTGGSSLLPIAGVPVLVTLACDESHWLVTSDSALAATWVAGAASGWTATPAAKLALEKAGPGAVMIGASDTPTLVRTMIPFIALGLGQSGLDKQMKQATLQSLGRLAALAKTGYLAGRVRKEGGTEIEMRGVLGYSVMPAIVAAIAIPNLIESRVASNEAAAATILKVGVHPAEIQFQAGGYVDANGNGIGDFGFLSEMAGGPVEGSTLTLNLLPETWNAVEPVINGYHYAVWLPDGKGGASGTPAERAAAKGPAEMHFVAYAWPSSREAGRRMFAITASGVVRATEWDGAAPEWFALWGEAVNDWVTAPAWPPYRR